MILTLYITGVIMLVLSVAGGILSSSFIEFVIALAGGITVAVILFALAVIIENQQNMLSWINYKEEILKRTLPQEKKTCSNCSYKYDADAGSCPHCGHRD